MESWGRAELSRAIAANEKWGDLYNVIFFLLLYQRRVRRGLP